MKQQEINFGTKPVSQSNTIIILVQRKDGRDFYRGFHVSDITEKGKETTGKAGASFRNTHLHERR